MVCKFVLYFLCIITFDCENSSPRKTKGNTSFQSKDYKNATEFYLKALELCRKDPNSSVAPLYFNIALCYSSSGLIADSISNCKEALLRDDKYEKAYFRLIKGLIESGRFQEARLFLLKAFKRCGETKELKGLEVEYNKLSGGLILRPSPNAFEVLDDELGDGNFSKMYKVANKTADATVYAMKVLSSIVPSCTD